MKGRIAGGGFFTEDNIMWHRPVGSIAFGCSIRRWWSNYPFRCTAERLL